MKAKEYKIKQLHESLTLKEQKVAQRQKTLNDFRYELNKTKLKLKRTEESTARHLNEKEEEIKKRAREKNRRLQNSICLSRCIEEFCLHAALLQQ